MGKKPTKKERALLIRWIIALSLGTSLLIALAVLMIRIPKPAPSPTIGPAGPTIPANPYGPEDFEFRDGRMECLSGEAVHGIDVSYYQGDVDWVAVKESGMEFAFIRLGYRSYDDGTLYVDEKAAQNLAGARAAGLKIGAYFFSQAISQQEALEEAEYALEILGDQTLELPLVFDWEIPAESARTGNLESDTLMACAHGFCGAVEAGGYQPMVYFNREQAKLLYDLEKLTQYPWWLAMYSEEMTFPYRVDFWQYSQEGRVPGIEGNVDLDLWFP